MTVPFSAEDTAALIEAFDGAIADAVAPGGVIAYGTAGSQPQFVSAGVIAPECGDAEPTRNTTYDIASLTKVVATWPLIGQALKAGLLDLDAPVRNFLPPMNGETPSGEATARQLLADLSGLRAATRLDHYRNAELPLHELLCREPLENAPGQHQNSNRGYILLGLVLAHVNRAPLNQLSEDLWQTLGMTSTAYGPVARAHQVAPTEQRILGSPRIWGSVHDENAAILGGIAGHAGVFTTPNDLAVYAQRLLAAYEDGDCSALGEWLCASLVPQTQIEPGPDRGLAWMLAAEGQVLYHHGFTGTSLYLAPESGRFLVICTNAIYHGPPHTRMATLRDRALTMISTT